MNDTHRDRRDQALADRGLKIENATPRFPQLDGKFSRDLASTQTAHRGGGNAGLPSNSAGLGFDRRNSDNYGNGSYHPADSRSGYKIVEQFSERLRRDED
jgi:hypothetical protein